MGFHLTASQIIQLKSKWCVLKTRRTVTYVWLTKMSNKPISVKLMTQYARAHMSVCVCWDVILCYFESSSHCSPRRILLWLLDTDNKGTINLWIVRNNYWPAMQGHIPEDLTLKHWNFLFFLNDQTVVLCMCRLSQQRIKAQYS